MHNHYETVMIAVIFIFSIGILALAGIAIVSLMNHRKRLERISMYQINTTAQIDKSIPDILDMIINESFMDYQVKVLLPEEGYINSDRETEIRNDIVALVTARISTAALDKLSLYYNIASMAEIIADKIYIAVMNYTASHNAKFTST